LVFPSSRSSHEESSRTTSWWCKDLISYTGGATVELPSIQQKYELNLRTISFNQYILGALHGKNIIAGRVSSEQSGVTFYSYNPAIAQEVKSTLFHEATSADIDAALSEAAKASSQLHQVRNWSLI